MTAQWYFAVAGRTEGPVSSDDLRRRASRGEISGNDLVWRDGMSDWVPAQSLGLAVAAAPPLPDAAEIEVPIAATPAVASSYRVAPPSGDPPRIPADLRPPPAPEKRTRQAGPTRSPTGGSGMSRAVWLTVGMVAILVSGIWIGRGMQTRSNDDDIARLAAAPPPTSHSHQSPRTDDVAASEVDTTQGLAGVAKTRPSERNVAVPAEPAIAPTVAPAIDPLVAPDVPAAEPPAPVPVPARPSPPGKPVSSAADSPAALASDRAGRLADDGPRIVFQTLEIHRKPTFMVSGLTLPQELRYRIVSQIQMEARLTDGSRKVVQIVERTHLDHADDLSRPTFAKSLKALEGQQYTFKLNDHHEVIEFTGPKKNAFSLPVTLPTSTGFQLTSVIDEDGWKELAQLTFFQPDASVAQGEPYVRQIAHDWTPLGSWAGTTTFVGTDVKGDLQSIEFQHALKYTPPTAMADAGPLGFRVIAAECTIDQADGTIEYDRKRNRVSVARETFRVHGTVAAGMMGRTTEIQLQEQQLMTVRVTDQRPSGN